MAFGLCIAALVLAGVSLVQSRGTNVLAIAVVLIATSLLWGRF